jgi:hypothetical protein
MRQSFFYPTTIHSRLSPLSFLYRKCILEKEREVEIMEKEWFERRRQGVDQDLRITAFANAQQRLLRALAKVMLEQFQREQQDSPTP